MNTSETFLKIRFDGASVGSARISVDHLLRFLTHFNKVLHRTARVLQGEPDSIKCGSPARDIKKELALDLVLLTEGSPAAVLGFERAQLQESLPGLDHGIEVFEKTLEGLTLIQNENITTMPEGYDSGVLTAWRDAGIILKQDITSIEITLNHRPIPLKTIFNSKGFDVIQNKIIGPQINIRTLEGRLLMADFKEHGTRCRIHPSIGDPVVCLFKDEMRDEVLENILHYVRVIGEAREDTATGHIESIQLHDIERLEDHEQQSTELLPQGTPVSFSFWDSPLLDELANVQNVKPLVNIDSLFGTWPGEKDDHFEEMMDELRRILI